jgi:hypothetical protein
VTALPDTDLAHPATLTALRAVFASGYVAGEHAAAAGDDTAARDAAERAILETEFTQHAVITATREVWSRGYTAGRATRIAGE